MRGFPEALQDHRPPRLVPRHDLRRDEPDRASRNEHLLRPVHVRRLPRAASEPYRSDSASRASRPTSWPPRHVEQEIIDPGSGDGRRGDRRADLDRGRRPRAVAEVLADAARDLRPARRAADRRRGHQRLRAHRHDVRHRAIRHRPRHHDDGQGRSPPATRRSRPRSSATRSSRSSRRSRKSVIGHLLTFGGHPVAAPRRSRTSRSSTTRIWSSRAPRRARTSAARLEELRVPSDRRRRARRRA